MVLDGTFKRAAVAHADPTKAARLHEPLDGGGPTLQDASGPGRVVRTGHATLDDIREIAGAEGIDAPGLMASLGASSSMCVPIVVGGRPGGAMTLVRSSEEGRFDDADLELVEELARRASMALDNAQAYRDLREANRLKDDFLATMFA